MKVNLDNTSVRRFQEGGPMPAEDPAMALGGAPAPEGAPEEGGDQMAQLRQVAQQIIEQLGPEGAAALAQMIMEMVQGGAAAPEQAQPVMQRLGGRFRRVK